MNATLVPTMTDGRPTPHSVPFILEAAMQFGYDAFGIAWGHGDHEDRWEARIAASGAPLERGLADELATTLDELKGADGGSDVRVLGEGAYAVVVLVGGVMLSEIEARARETHRDAVAGMCRRLAESWSASLIDAV